MSKITNKQIWTFAAVLLIFVSLNSGVVSAKGRNGLFSCFKSGGGSGLFSCSHAGEMTADEQVAEQSEDATQASAETVEKKQRNGLLARIRSKKSEKGITTDAQDLTEQSSSDLPAENIPPAPKK